MLSIGRTPVQPNKSSGSRLPSPRNTGEALSIYSNLHLTSNSTQPLGSLFSPSPPSPSSRLAKLGISRPKGLLNCKPTAPHKWKWDGKGWFIEAPASAGATTKLESRSVSHGTLPAPRGTNTSSLVIGHPETLVGFVSKLERSGRTQPIDVRGFVGDDLPQAWSGGEEEHEERPGDRFLVKMPTAKEPQPYDFPGMEQDQIDAFRYYETKSKRVPETEYRPGLSPVQLQQFFRVSSERHTPTEGNPRVVEPSSSPKRPPRMDCPGSFPRRHLTEGGRGRDMRRKPLSVVPTPVRGHRPEIQGVSNANNRAQAHNGRVRPLAHFRAISHPELSWKGGIHQAYKRPASPFLQEHSRGRDTFSDQNKPDSPCAEHIPYAEDTTSRGLKSKVHFRGHHVDHQESSSSEQRNELSHDSTKSDMTKGTTPLRTPSSARKAMRVGCEGSGADLESVGMCATSPELPSTRSKTIRARYREHIGNANAWSPKPSPKHFTIKPALRSLRTASTSSVESSASFRVHRRSRESLTTNILRLNGRSTVESQAAVVSNVEYGSTFHLRISLPALVYAGFSHISSLFLCLLRSRFRPSNFSERLIMFIQEHKMLLLELGIVFWAMVAVWKVLEAVKEALEAMLWPVWWSMKWLE